MGVQSWIKDQAAYLRPVPFSPLLSTFFGVCCSVEKTWGLYHTAVERVYHSHPIPHMDEARRDSAVLGVVNFYFKALLFFSLKRLHSGGI
jgi:hypothetical protein